MPAYVGGSPSFDERRRVVKYDNIAHNDLRGRQAIKVSITRPFQVWIRRRIGTFIL